MNIAPDMTAFVYYGGALAAFIIGTLLFMFIRGFMDERENSRPGENKRTRYMMRFVHETNTIKYIGYYSTNTMKPYLQEHPKYATVMTGYPAAKSVFNDYAKLKMGQVREQLQYMQPKCKIVLMEERTYFGIKAWYDLTEVDLVP
ncbi:hypothetical protein D3C87_1009090 [compost metagenome]